MVAIPLPPGQPWSWATGVSADGTTVCGYAGSSFSTRAGWEGFRWSISGTMDVITVADSGVWVNGISADGSMVVGTSAHVAVDDGEAFTWTAGDGIHGLGGLSDGPFRSNADGVSADGRVVVGDSLDVTGGVRDAFRWESGVMRGLGAFTAAAASRDGSVVVGAISQAGREAYRWTAGAGTIPLGTYDENQDSFALDVSGNGAIVVGYLEDQTNDVQRAFVWDPVHGMQLLQDVLVNEFGQTQLAGWRLTRATAVSDDGRTIVGVGYDPDGNPHAWRVLSSGAPIPEPATCLLLALAGPLVLRGRRRNRPAR